MLLILADDVSRVSHELLSQQTLTEVLVSELDGKVEFQDAKGGYHEISEWPGVTMDAEGSITGISFGRNFESYFAGGLDDPEVFELTRGGSVDLQWLPQTTKTLNLSCMGIDGSADTVMLPRVLDELDLTENMFSGSFDMVSLPVSIQRIEIAENVFSGNLDLSANLPSLYMLSAQINRFSGSLNLTALPPRIRWIYVERNKFSGSISLLHLPDSLNHLNISNNQLTQDILHVGEKARRMQDVTIDADKFEKFVDEKGNDIPPQNLGLSGFKWVFAPK
mmetsp:Transcript_7095/g.10726  ORF Transcript_7095/g.10726 Transcript_7095/m.10726 type:complete len:278 (-) Transcript_7095:57-890(-)